MAGVGLNGGWVSMKGRGGASWCPGSMRGRGRAGGGAEWGLGEHEGEGRRDGAGTIV